MKNNTEIQIYNNTQKNIETIKNTAWTILSSESQKAYQNDYKLFFKFINKNPDEIIPTDILSFIEYLKNEGFKNSSINRKISSLSKMFNVMKIAGEIKENPIDTLKKFKNISMKTSKEVRNILTIKDVKNASKFSKHDNIFIKRNCIMIKLLAKTGLRISEMLDIEYSNVKIHNDKTMIVRIVGKGNKERYIFIEKTLWKEILSLWPERYNFVFYSKKNTKYMRQSAWRIIKEIFKEKTGKNISPHMLRHFFVTYKIATEKKDIKSVSRYVGHSDVSTTLGMYVDTSLDSDDSEIDI